MRSSTGSSSGSCKVTSTRSCAVGPVSAAPAQAALEALEVDRAARAGEAHALDDLGDGADRGELAVGRGDQEDALLVTDRGSPSVTPYAGEDDG